MSTGPTFTLPPQIMDMLAKGLVSMQPGAAGCSWHIIGEWDDALGPKNTHTIRLKTDAGPITFLRGQGMERT